MRHAFLKDEEGFQFSGVVHSPLHFVGTQPADVQGDNALPMAGGGYDRRAL